MTTDVGAILDDLAGSGGDAWPRPDGSLAITFTVPESLGRLAKILGIEPGAELEPWQVAAAQERLRVALVEVIRNANDVRAYLRAPLGEPPAGG